MASSHIQAVAAGADIHKREGAYLTHTQRDIQITQAHIAIDAQHFFAKLRQGFRDTGANRGFTRAAFAGQNSDQFAQGRPLLS